MHCKLSRLVSQVITAQIHTQSLDPLPLGHRYFNRFPLWLRVAILCLPLLLVQCATLQQEEAAALPLDDALPASWTALRDVQEVNIDGDGAAEYLLFFTYDALGAAPSTSWFFAERSIPRGPIGAVIYDAQVITGTATAERVSPDKPTNALVPYAILPSYRRAAGQGFVAAPTQGEGVQAYPVSYRSLAQTASTAADTLIFFAGGAGADTYLTFAWWQNRADGYGVTQLYAPGGFETALYTTFDWAQWQRNPQPIQTLIAVHPLHDRNLLCRRIQYQLSGANDTTTTSASEAPPIHYQRTDLGLHFCAGTPAHPFYPEGVVLAYLLEGSSALLDVSVATATGDNSAPPPLATEGEGIGWLQQLVQTQRVVRVDDLASYATLVTTTTPLVAAPPDTLVVCAALTLATTASASAGGADRTQQTGLLFTLRHQPAGFQPPTPDQLFITNVETIAAPSDESMVNCHALLGG